MLVSSTWLWARFQLVSKPTMTTWTTLSDFIPGMFSEPIATMPCHPVVALEVAPGWDSNRRKRLLLVLSVDIPKSMWMFGTGSVDELWALWSPRGGVGWRMQRARLLPINYKWCICTKKMEEEIGNTRDHPPGQLADYEVGMLDSYLQWCLRCSHMTSEKQNHLYFMVRKCPYQSINWFFHHSFWWLQC